MARFIVKSEDGKKFARYSTVVMGFTTEFMSMQDLKADLAGENWDGAYSGFDNAKTARELRSEGMIGSY